MWTKEKRSEVMSRIKQKDTKPEILVRKALFNSGYRYRLHKKGLPGSPDIVLAKYRAVIFVNGCFWHYHKKCRDGHIPKSRREYWKKKLDRNVERDKKVYKNLKENGWRVLIVWECEAKKDIQKSLSKIERFLNSGLA